MGAAGRRAAIGSSKGSGKYHVTGIRVDASAPSGRGGLWLLDPNNITIQTTGSDTSITGSPNFTTTGDGAVLLTGTIEGQLNAGTSVSVTTGTASPSSDAGNINVNGSITKSVGTNATLTLNAHNDVNINASITSSVGQLNLVLNPDSDSNASGAINPAPDANANFGTISAPAKCQLAGARTINSAFNLGTRIFRGHVAVPAGERVPCNHTWSGGSFSGNRRGPWGDADLNVHEEWSAAPRSPPGPLCEPAPRWHTGGGAVLRPSPTRPGAVRIRGICC